eukprot:CAMPEP_0184499648 /NCGR_PEP_ID=MMETSP0113_2-20130426/42067_1 /TAXON_ID=91329 /ORGANISM="Norrisiella sphaerica, Strain BC52" /LENGTH=273 /DNA_ID=CAMNT_0026887631 /DNA_START=101 /DNA_END=919 /DNA_ORIENTATION=-
MRRSSPGFMVFFSSVFARLSVSARVFGVRGQGHAFFRHQGLRASFGAPARHLAAAAAALLASAQPGSHCYAQDRESDKGFKLNVPIWRQELERSIKLESKSPTSKFMTLATMAGDQPRARTVVFRGFLEEAESLNALKIITDIRSDKIGEIEANPNAELMWYFLDTREQFRIRGELEVISHKSQDPVKKKWRELQWEQTSEGMKQSYEWPSPGTERQPTQDDQADFFDFDASEEPSPNFALLLMIPKTVDVVKLREKPQKRHIHSKKKGEETW